MSRSSHGLDGGGDTLDVVVLDQGWSRRARDAAGANGQWRDADWQPARRQVYPAH
ncbi:MAG: hypothetical protein AB7U65_10185 [Halothiobacillaceae bacterium]